MAKQSLYRGSLNLGTVKIPVAIYGTFDCFEIEGHLYHEDCDGKIRQKTFCEVHPNLEGPVSYSGIDIGGQIVKVDSELRNTLLDRKAPFIARSVHKLSTLGSFMAENAIVPLAMFEVAPQEPADPKMSIHHNAMFTLFERMEAKKVFLLCSVGLAGLNRLAILLPGGQLYVLTYREEIREFTDYSGEIDRPLARYVDAFFAGEAATSVPVVSLAKYRKRVASWFASVLAPPVVAKKPKTNPKKKVPAKSLYEQLTGD